MGSQIDELMSGVWETVLKQVGKEGQDESFDLWFRPLRPVSFENGVFTLQCPNKFFSDWIKQNYQTKIEQIVTQQTGTEVKLELIIRQELEEETKKTEIQTSVTEPRKERSDFAADEFDPRYTFESFIVGPSNRFAQAAAEAVAKEPGKAFNPLFIYGGVGLGKTHLLHAIGHQTKQLNPGTKVLYITSEKFINDFIDSLRYERLVDFRNNYRKPDCLLIDDIQFLMGKQSSQEEFFYTFNTLYDSRKQIVVTSDRPPKEIATLQERLISRFEWGVVADIQPPEFETRVAILRKKATNEKVYVPEDVIVFIAEQIQTNIRQLEGALIRVVAFASLLGTEVTVDRAKEVLRDIITKKEIAQPVTIERIQRVVAKHFHLNPKEMSSKKRTDAIAFPRQIAMYLARSLTECSTTEIGQSFGGKDHTTVMHACNKIKLRLSSDPYFVALINKIVEEIKKST